MFVANRVQFIRENSHLSQWLHVRSENNPDDHASRGLLVDDLLRSNWFAGPEFL